MANGKAVHMAKFLRGIDFPATKADLISHATQKGADEHLLATLGRLPAQTFEGAFGLSRAFGETGREELALAELPHAAQGTFEKFTFQNPAGSREYFVYIPANHQLGTAVPLLVILHGCTETPQDFADITQMNQLADQNQFIVVYPQQTSVDNQEECWNWFDASDQSRGGGEPSILAGITQTVQQNTTHWTIDPKRVYVAGLSAGAAMAVILGATYPDLFAAIGVHSGLEYEAATSQLGAFLAMFLMGGPDPMLQGQLAFHAMGSFARVVPTIVFHGTNDNTVHLINGDQAIRQWMETNRLASQGAYTPDFHKPSNTVSGQVPGGRSYTMLTWNDSSGNVVQAYWKVDGMDHAWSGGIAGKPFSDPRGPNASLAMYQFFLAHPRS